MLKFTRLFQVLRSHQPTHRRTLLYTEIAIPWPGLPRGEPRFFLPLLFWLFVPVALIIINLLYLVKRLLNLSTFSATLQCPRSECPIGRQAHQHGPQWRYVLCILTGLFFALLKNWLLSLMFATGGPLALLNLDLLAGHRPPLPPLRGHSIPGRCNHTNDKNYRTKR